jgi:pimeloyl-ACP methyl ester carboxylesterase
VAFSFNSQSFYEQRRTIDLKDFRNYQWGCSWGCTGTNDFSQNVVLLRIKRSVGEFYQQPLNNLDINLANSTLVEQRNDIGVLKIWKDNTFVPLGNSKIENSRAYLLTHGWGGPFAGLSDSNLKEWVNPSAAAIANLDNGAAILAWDWSPRANEKVLPPFIAVGSMAMQLERALREAASANTPNGKTSLSFIGHSLGAGISALTAESLSRGLTSYSVEKLTLLDAPETILKLNLTDRLSNISARSGDTIIDNYYGAGPYLGSVPAFGVGYDAYRVTNNKLIGSGHVDVPQWYKSTIENPPADPSTGSRLGFFSTFAASGTSHCLNTWVEQAVPTNCTFEYGPLPPASTPSLSFSNDFYAYASANGAATMVYANRRPEVNRMTTSSADIAETFGARVQGGRLGVPTGLSGWLIIPEAVGYVSFTVLPNVWSITDELLFTIEGEVVFYAYGSQFDADTWLDGPLVDVSKWAGKEVKLVQLYSAQSELSSVTFGEIKFFAAAVPDAPTILLCTFGLLFVVFRTKQRNAT